MSVANPKFRGEHSDARELAALYVKSGVPVYPLFRGFSYQTLTWRMSVEAREITTAEEKRTTRPRGISGGGTHGDDGAGTSSGDAATGVESSGMETTSIDRDIDDCQVIPFLDPFYSRRYEGRESGVYYNPNMTYLEEKCLFWQHQSGEVESSDWQTFLEQRRHSLTSAVALRPPAAPGLGLSGNDASSASPTSLPPRRTASSNNLTVSTCLGARGNALPRHRPQCLVRIHRHLADRHLLGCAAVNAHDEQIKSVSLSLGADFFHPLFSSKSAALVHINSPAQKSTVLPSDSSQNALSATFVDNDIPSAGDNLTGNSLRESDTRVLPPQAAGEDLKMFFPIDFDAPDVELEVYSSASIGISKVQDEKTSHSFGGGERCQHQRTESNLPLLSLRSRFAFFQRKLDSHLAHYQSVAFDECLLDFWDEFLPSTKGVHFHDGHTPVPRMFDLRRFLTNPCPKSYGTVQCEIERIKTISSKKGVNVKGRLFPSYQYRLFIRDKREDEQTTRHHGVATPRIDTILMTAKYKDKQIRATPGTGQSTPGSTGKRGVNNYYLYMPTDRDIKSHFSAVNEATVCNGLNSPDQRLFSSSAGKATPREVGRLQSNFIGTEFQIFAPSFSRRQNQSLGLRRGFSQSSKGCSRSSSFDSASGSDIDMEVSSIVSQDTCGSLHSSPQRTMTLGHAELRNGLIISKRSLSRRSSHVSSIVSSTEEVDDVGAAGISSTFHQSRRRSWPSLRYSRRAIAQDIGDNNPHAHDIPSSKNRFAEEEEEVGVITYTANLLGNRPRIMDVCIPKISDEGSVSPAWKCHIDAALEMGLEETMMTRFKQLQQFSSQHDNIEGAVGQNLSEGDIQGMSPNEFGLLALQNRPPWWNAELGAFVLNFGGRVSVASVKNFQLCDRRNQEHVMLQFGRIEGRHSFTMDFQHPLSATQAFAM